MSRIKLITLDLDNTLWDVDSIIIKAEQELVAWLETHVPDSLSHYQGDTLKEIRAQVFAAHEHLSHDLSFMRTQVLFEVMRRTGLADTEARRRAEQAFEVFFEGRNRVVLFSGAEDMLASLNERFNVYALTNGNANIDRAGISGYFAGAYSSADVGNKKPHPDMFHAPLTELDLTPDQAIHIGDHLIDDIQGAANVGMHSIWVNLTDAERAHHEAAPTREVTALTEVKNAVEEIGSN